MVTNASRHKVTESYLGGVPENEIAKRMGYSVDQVRGILRERLEVSQRSVAYFRVRFLAEMQAHINRSLAEVEREVRAEL